MEGYVMSQQDAKANKTIAIIGGVVSVVVALTGCVSSAPTPTILAPATSPSISTVIPTATYPPTADLGVFPCTFYQSCQPGDDWLHDCISQQWAVYPYQEIPADVLGCYRQPIWGSISTKNGGLYILAQHKNLIRAEEYGIFAQLPQSGTVSLKIDLDVIDNGEIWVGIFSKPDIYSPGMLIVVPPGPVKEHAFGVRSMPDQRRMEVTKIYKNELGVYSLGFDLYMGAVNAVIESVVHDDQRLAFPSASRWLFIGYRAKLEIANGATKIEALIKDLAITPN